MSSGIYCKSCGKQVKHHKSGYGVTFINIKQNPAILYFCNNECRLKHIKQIKGFK